MNIKFGTDGWRAKIADEFTFDNVRRVAQAIADYVTGCKPQVIVGYDRRFLSLEYARAASEVLAANGIKVLLTKEPVPTPAVSLAIKKMGLDGGIVVTASHNPPSFNGIKIKTRLAMSADSETTKYIEGLVGRYPIKSMDLDSALKNQKVEIVDISAGYIKFLQRYVDVDKIRKANNRVLVDCMHGVGAGYIEAVLANKNIRIESIRNNADPLFGGVNPEPIPKNLGLSQSYIKGKRFDLGIALDGDADRIGAIRPDGRYITSGQIISMILLHFLKNRPFRGAVVKTISGTTLIEYICRKYNLKMFEVPVGFKNISSLMLKDGILIGGEESGGIGFCNYIPERDGILSALLLLEMLAYDKKPIISIMKDIDKEFGRFCYDRLDIECPFKRAHGLSKKLKTNPPVRINNKKIVAIKTYDGIKFIMDDESWLLLRFSGTEPLIRIYAEARSDRDVKRLLAAGKGLAGLPVSQLAGKPVNPQTG